MNGVLHSEHVISRSGIAVSPTRVKTRTFTLLLFGALALRFFQPRVVGRKRCSLQTHAEKLASRRLVGLKFTPATRSIQFFYANFNETVAQDLQRRGELWHSRNRSLLETAYFARHIGCSLIIEK
jgi:hypothetical protein